MTSVVHISGLVNEIERRDLENICRPYGAVVQIRLGRGVPKEGFVEFKDPNSAANIVRELNGQEMRGIKIELYVNDNNEFDSFRSRKYRKKETYSTKRDTSESRTEDYRSRKSSRNMFDWSRDTSKYVNPLRCPRREFGNGRRSPNYRRVDASKGLIALKRDRCESRARSPCNRDEDFRQRGLMRNDSSKSRRHDNWRSRNHLNEDEDRNINRYDRFTSRDRSESPPRQYHSVMVQPAKRRRIDSTGSSYSTASSQHSSVSSRGLTPDSGNWD